MGKCRSNSRFKKIIQLADLFGVSTDYLLKDEVEKENTETICDTDCELHRVSMEEANTYMDEKKKQHLCLRMRQHYVS